MRAMLERISPVLIASVLAGGFVVASALPASAEPGDERRDRLHAVRPVAAAQESPAFVHPDLAAQIEQAEAEERAAADAWYAGVLRAEAEAAAEAAAASRAESGGSVRTVSHGGCNGDVACFLECTRAHESDTSGGYGAVSRGGTYRGAYQFAQPTWDAAVAGAGHAEYAGTPADQVPVEVQDAAAAHLYSVSGTRPWGGRC
jgi:hypothetical protein